MNEEVCCGNGCNNCVLDQQHGNATINCDNVLSSGYTQFEITGITKCTKCVFEIGFKFCGVRRGLIIPPGTHLMMRLRSDVIERQIGQHFETIADSPKRETPEHVQRPAVNDPDNVAGEFVSRVYSPFEYDTSACTFKCLFRYEAGGEMSQRIARLAVGDVLEFKGFYGSFEWCRNKYKYLNCFAQGVAVAPLISVVRHILNDEEDETRIHFVACFRDFEDVLLKDLLTDFQRYWNFKLTLMLPYHPCHSPCDCRNGTNRLYNEATIFEKLNSANVKQLICNVNSDNYHLISGSVSFETHVSRCLKDNDVPEENIHCF